MNLWLIFLLIPSLAIAGELRINFTEGHFYDQYRHSTYIEHGRYVHIDDHWDSSDSEGLPRAYIPKFYSVELSPYQESELIERLRELGVAAWETSYPEDTEGLLCHGLGFWLYIDHPSLRVNTRGSCEQPPNYDEVVELIYGIHEHLLY